jgi:hypothetical protein
VRQAFDDIYEIVKAFKGFASYSPQIFGCSKGRREKEFECFLGFVAADPLKCLHQRKKNKKQT